MVTFNMTSLASVGALAQQIHMISNFQGHFLNLAFANNEDGTPINTKIVNTPVGSESVWVFQEQSDGSVQIQCGTGTFLSYPNVIQRGAVDFAPATSSLEEPLSFNIVAAPGGTGSLIVPVGTNTPLGLTAWQSVSNINDDAPVTYSPSVSGAIEQIWTISTFAIPSSDTDLD